MRLLNWVMSMIGRRVTSTEVQHTGVELHNKKLALEFAKCSKMVIIYVNRGLRVQNTDTHKQYKFNKKLLWAILEVNPGIEIEMRNVPRSYYQGIAIEVEKFKRKKVQDEGMSTSKTD